MAKDRRAKKKAPSRVPRPPNKQQLTLHRRSVATVTKLAGDTGYAYFVLLSDFNSSDIVSLFSEYKILSIKATHQLVNAPNNNATFPRLHIAPRGFSNVNPVSRAETLQYNGLDQFQFGPAAISHTGTYKPYVWLDAVGTTTGKNVVQSPWLGTDNDTVRHNYAVTWMDRYNTTTDPTHTIELLLDVVIVVRGPR
jgi:hypothetical protein